MIREIEAKTLLIPIKNPMGWFGVKYNMNIYRGCEHRCIYCDSRSECYQIEDFDGEVLVKANAIELLEKELARKRIRGTVGTGAMSDPYTYTEKRYGLTGKALGVIARHRFPAHITTKSDLVLKDLEVLREIAHTTRASVGFTLTTTDDALAAQVEPGAPRPSARLEAMARLAEAGVLTGTLVMPILPFIEDSPENITAIVHRTAEAGGKFITPWFGMSLRAGQREYFYEQLDRRFPGLRSRYEKCYGERYSCPTPNERALWPVFHAACEKYGLATDMSLFAPPKMPEQLKLF
ncbi:MAG: SPL family radical SAM protein [Chloroflexota bacterium]